MKENSAQQLLQSLSLSLSARCDGESPWRREQKLCYKMIKNTNNSNKSRIGGLQVTWHGDVGFHITSRSHLISNNIKYYPRMSDEITSHHGALRYLILCPLISSHLISFHIMTKELNKKCNTMKSLAVPIGLVINLMR